MAADPLPPAAKPEHLTQVLRRAGALSDGRVSGVAVESSRTRLLSHITRLRLAYEGVAERAPLSLILKTGLLERVQSDWGSIEVGFYTKVAPAMAEMLFPRCFEARSDGETGGWHLILEDLTQTHLVLEGWPMPPIFDDCERIVAALARFHAAWWDDPRLGASVGVWLDEKDGERMQQFAARVARFGERLGDRLSQERRDLYQRLIEAGPRLGRRYHSHRHMTLLHGDAHVWNALLPRDGSDDVRFVDWDSARIGVGASDLAYMMALHWYPEHRRRAERSLLDRYHAELLARGIAGYDRRALDDDYRLSALWQIATPVWQFHIDLPAWIWWPHVERAFLALEDLGCRELLSG